MTDRTRNWLVILILSVLAMTCISLLIPAVQKSRETARRVQSINSFKGIALSIHSFHDSNKVLPTPTRLDKDGREIQLSWRFSIVPYIDSGPLYGKMDRDAAWDHPNNARFRDLRLPVYECPHREPDEPGQTRFQYFTGPRTMFPANVPLAMRDIKDGTSFTFLFAEADHAVTWTRPADMDIDPDNALPLPTDYFIVSMVDGRVRIAQREKLADTLLRQFIDPNDGEPKSSLE